MKTNRLTEGEAHRLASQGLSIPRPRAFYDFLSSCNPYRFSAYARYFRVDPTDADSPFLPGSSWLDIRRVYEADQGVRTLLAEPLARVEVLLRAQTAHVIADRYGEYGHYLEHYFYDDPPDRAGVVESFMRDIARNMDRRLMEYWHDMEALNHELSDMPVWVGVEALTFGTLSKVIQRGARGKLADEVAERIGVARSGFSSRVKSFVYLRNRCAHHSQLWNHWVIDAGATPNNVRSKARRVAGDFAPRSLIDIVASMDDMLVRAHVSRPVLPDLAADYSDDDVIWRGLCEPRPLHPEFPRPELTHPEFPRPEFSQMQPAPSRRAFPDSLDYPAH